MHCVGELDTNNRGVGASKVDAAAQDGVGSSTPEFDDSGQNAVGISTPGNPGAPELDPGAQELYATIGVTVQARSTRN